jgi:hypothetical protein
VQPHGEVDQCNVPLVAAEQQLQAERQHKAATW